MRLSALICLSLSSIAAVAAPQVQVVGLFPGAAVLNIDGQRKLVKVGQSGPEGVQVVSADSHKAVLRIGGVEQTYELSREYNSGGYAAPSARTEMSIARAPAATIGWRAPSTTRTRSSWWIPAPPLSP